MSDAKYVPICGQRVRFALQGSSELIDGSNRSAFRDLQVMGTAGRLFYRLWHCIHSSSSISTVV
jgi:hypothetical protein